MAITPRPFPPPTPFSAPINAGSADNNVPAVAGTSGKLLGQIFEPGTGIGVWGLSGGPGAGVYGDSGTGAGVYGTSTGFDGVHGESQSNQHAGVSGINNSGGPGVYASGNPAGQFEGNVGIGTANPGSDVSMTGGLTINGTNATQMTVQQNGTSAFALNVSSGQWTMYDKMGGTWNPSITSKGGKIGIGTANPGSDVSMTGGLTINGTNATQMTVQQNGTSAFALNVSSGQWTMYDKMGGPGIHPSLQRAATLR